MQPNKEQMASIDAYIKANPAPNAPITADTLNKTVNPVSLPDNLNQVDTSSLNAQINASLTDAKNLSQTEREKQALIQKNQEETKKISELMTDVGQEEALRKRYAMEEGAYDAKKQYDEYVSQIEAEQLAIRRKMEEVRTTFTGLKGGMQEELGRIERNSLSKQADLAILQNAAARRYDTAMSIAKDKVEMELAPKKAQLEGLKFIYENNKAFQTAEFSALLNRQQKEIDKEQEEKEASNQMILNAIQGGAPQSLVSKAQDMYNQGKSKNEIATVLGRYSQSLAERLDTQLKQAQINKLNAPSIADAPTVKSINGVDMQWDGSKWIPAVTSGTPSNQGEILSLQDKLQNIDSLINHKGLSNAVGTVALGRKAPLQIGQKQDFIAGVQQLVSRDTLDTLINLKKAGGTLGALSDQERIMLQSAASKIGTWKREDKNGNVVGYKASESAFKKELETIKALTQRALSEAGGDITDNYLNMLEGVLQVNPYLQAGYILE